MITAIRNVQVFENGTMSNEDYHAHEYVSGSSLCVIENDCPAVLKFGEHKESQALHFGIASHAALLEPELFDKAFARDLCKADFDVEDKDGNVTSELLASDAAIKARLKEIGVKGYSTKTGYDLAGMLYASEPNAKIFNLEVLAHAYVNKEKTLVRAEDYDMIMSMRSTVFANDEYAEMLDGCFVETSVICEVQLDGCEDWIGVKVRPDIITKNFEVPDYKTTRDVRAEPFGRQAYYAGYLLKQAFVCDVLSAAYGNTFKPGLLAQAKSEPFIPQNYWLTDDQVAIGRAQYSYALGYYNHCKKNDMWPAYNKGSVDLEIPDFVSRKYFPS